MFSIIGLLLLLGALTYFSFVVVMLRGLLNSRPRTVSEHKPSVAVIVAARNEADDLPDLLADLIAQNYTGKFECIIADDRSTDETWNILHKFSKLHSSIKPVRITQESTEMTGKKNALTQCIKNTTAEILLETDADCRVGPDWITAMVAQFDDTTGLVVGLSTVRQRSLFAIYQALDFMGIMMSNAGMMHWGKAWSGSGQNLAFRRALFTAIGGFTGDAGQTIGDDFYLVQKISKLKGVLARFSWDPGSFVHTNASGSLTEFYQQRVRWASDTRGLHLNSPLFFTFLLSAFVLNATLLIHCLSFGLSLLFLSVIGIKFILEFFVVAVGFSKIDRQQDLWMFLPWFLLQPLYIPVMGIAGLLGKVSWK